MLFVHLRPQGRFCTFRSESSAMEGYGISSLLRIEKPKSIQQTNLTMVTSGIVVSVL